MKENSNIDWDHSWSKGRRLSSIQNDQTLDLQVSFPILTKTKKSYQIGPGGVNILHDDLNTEVLR